MERDELVQAVEAMIFASGRPVSAKAISEILEVETKEIEEAINVLKEKLIERNSGVQIIKVNDMEVKSLYQLTFFAKNSKLFDDFAQKDLIDKNLEQLKKINQVFSLGKNFSNIYTNIIFIIKLR